VSGDEGTQDVSDETFPTGAAPETVPFLQAILRTTRDGVWVTDHELRIVDVNDAYCRMSGYAREELLQLTVGDVDPTPRVQARRAQIVRDGSALFEAVHRRKDGSLFDVEASVSRVDPSGTRFVSFFRDITDRKRAERELRGSRERLSLFMDSASDAVYLLDADLRFVEINRRGLEIVGKPREEVIGRSLVDVVPDARSSGRYAQHLEVLRTGEPFVVEDHVPHPVFGDLHIYLKSFRVGDGLAVVAIDITGVKKAEQALRESETRLRTLSDNIPGGFVYQIDSGLDGRERRFTHVSAGVERIFGIPVRAIMDDARALYQTILEEDRPGLVAAEGAALATMTTFRAEARMRSVSGEARWYLMSSTPRRSGNGRIVWDGVAVDITERKHAEQERLRLETHLSQVQKLDALGILAAGIAHDFNNLLSGVFGCIDLALEETRGLAAGRHLSRAMEAMDRARTLTQQLLTFAKGGTPMRRTGSLVQLVEETTRFALSGSNVTARFDLPADAWPCDFDRSQLAQAIENIVINAQQAMPSGGTIEVDAANVTLRAGDHASLPPGDYARVSIRDHGIGMPHDILPRIFDPFFTTKQKGHGLGLATCYSIVSRHGGAIDVDSEPGHGSVFRLSLPASPGAAEPAPEATPAEHRGTGTILVMDDEEVVREVTGDMLHTFGYAVLAARDGREALEVFAAERAAGRGFVGMIFDLTVPGGMGGLEALAEIRKLDPAVPVLVSSGYAEDPVVAAPQEYGFTASIAKPFRRSELAEVLRRHLPAGRR
jgi:PAS domain S-box-containing protein